jgi:hypothetical protein
MGEERAFRESDTTFIGDWNIPLEVVVFATTSGREAAAISPQGPRRKLAATATTGCV